MARLKAKRKQQTKSSDSETTKLIRKTRQATRKRYTAEEKIRIVMEGVRGEEPVSAICRREGVRPQTYLDKLGQQIRCTLTSILADSPGRAH